jgi:predicted Rossmann fold nucleotide-binding protein DprA/Smf involved in DNA uptake
MLKICESLIRKGAKMSSNDWDNLKEVLSCCEFITSEDKVNPRP